MVQYNEAGVTQKCKNSTHQVAMVSEDDDASADIQSSSCSCASARPTCWPTGTVSRVTDRKRRLTDRHGRSRHWPEASTERPPLVVDYVLSFWTAWSRRPLTVVLYRSCRRPSAVVLTNVADEHVRWRRRTAGSTWPSNWLLTKTLIVDDYDRWQKASKPTSTLLTRCW